MVVFTTETEIENQEHLVEIQRVSGEKSFSIHEVNGVLIKNKYSKPRLIVLGGCGGEKHLGAEKYLLVGSEDFEVREAV